MRLHCAAVLLLMTGIANAFEFSSFLPFLKSDFDSSENYRVAIVGAGAGGSSAAFWLSKVQERFSVQLDVHVYDREPYVGGRSTVVYPYNDTSLKPVELGASIFVSNNKNLWRATEEFGLARNDYDDEETDMGVWDGEEFIFRAREGNIFSGLLSMAKVLWRYGFTAPTRTRALVKATVNKFVTLYDAKTPKWSTISELATKFEWDTLAAQTGAEHLDKRGVSKKFTREIVEAATRVNYGQNLDEIHALEALVSMAANGASNVQGGNFQIFENFLNASGAKVFLDTKVRSITQKSDSWVLDTSRGSATYHSVIFAAPYHSTGIGLYPSTLSASIPKQPYVHLHVTLLTTTTPHPNPSYFSLPPNVAPPAAVLTTYEGARNGKTEPEFNSLTYHGLISDDPNRKEWVVKIFSMDKLSDDWLAYMFQGQVGWVLRKEWDAYPELPPTSSFPPVKLDRGFYYVNAFEPFISTMETETISARNVVDLLLKEELGTSICGPAPYKEEVEGQRTRQAPFKTPRRNTDFVYGWDC